MFDHDVFGYSHSNSRLRCLRGDQRFDSQGETMIQVDAPPTDD
jgi:hypothetical protein